MKRSEINTALEWAVALLEKNNIKLPDFAYWSTTEWQKNRNRIDVIKAVMQGWDITDFGSGDFEKTGAVLFTVRNGLQNDSSVGSPYAEKYILVKDGQGLPTHFHAQKTEDIINRGGGVLSLRFYNANPDNTVDTQSDVFVFSDGLRLTLKAGEEVLLKPGNSVTITPRLYHNFSAKAGEGDLIVGEVSSVNDDKTDNYFSEPANRFAAIDEDVPVLYPLCNEYDNI